jgi:hypothetical protein
MLDRKCCENSAVVREQRLLFDGGRPRVDFSVDLVDCHSRFVRCHCSRYLKAVLQSSKVAGESRWQLPAVFSDLAATVESHPSTGSIRRISRPCTVCMDGMCSCCRSKICFVTRKLIVRCPRRAADD